MQELADPVRRVAGGMELEGAVDLVLQQRWPERDVAVLEVLSHYSPVDAVALGERVDAESVVEVVSDELVDDGRIKPLVTTRRGGVLAQRVLQALRQPSSAYQLAQALQRS